jgi:cytochrome P450
MSNEVVAVPQGLEDIDFFSTVTLADPHPVLRRLRREAPVFPAYQASHGRVQYLVTTYDLVQQVLTSPQLYSSRYVAILAGEGRSHPEVDAIRAQGFQEINSILTSDDGEHKRLRSLVGAAFVPQRVKKMGEDLVEVIEALIDGFASRGECDFNAEFAALLPAHSLARVMGFDHDRYADIHRWSNAIASRFGQMADVDQQIADERAILEAKRYMVEIVAQRRAVPGDDLISDLIAARAEDETPLTDLEILSTIFILLIGGIETTLGLLGFVMVRLLRDPALMAAVRADESLVPPLVEEVLRMETPIAAMWRIARADVELGGVAIPRGSILMTRLDSANRDEKRFANPDRFDMGRAGNMRHVSFGGGVHACLGFRLARLELAIAIPALLRRLKNIRIVEEKSDLDIVPSTHARNLRALHIAFDPS